MKWYNLNTILTLSTASGLIADSHWNPADASSIGQSSARALYVRVRQVTGQFATVGVAGKDMGSAWNKLHLVTLNHAMYFWLDCGADQRFDYNLAGTAPNNTRIDVLGWSDTAFGFASYVDYSATSTGWNDKTYSELASGDVFALLLMHNTNGASYYSSYTRADGSADDYTRKNQISSITAQYCPVSAAKGGDIYIENVAIDTYLAGGLPGVNFVATERTQVTIPGTGWRTVTCPPVVPAGAIGVLLDCVNASASNVRDCVVRKTGYGDPGVSPIQKECRQHLWAELDGNDTEFDINVSNATDVTAYVIGYLVNQAVIEVSIGPVQFAMSAGVVDVEAQLSDVRHGFRIEMEL